MTGRIASCRCGQLRATVTGEPGRVSVCHCLNCKKRSGSAFAVQARWLADEVAIEGRSSSWVMVADSGNPATYHLNKGKFEGMVAIPLGAFDDPYFVSPKFSVWEKRKHEWVEISGDNVEHSH